jgi:hypothetical protein
VVGELGAMTSERDADDADVQEQRTSVAPTDDEVPSLPHDAEVPEADALDQSIEVPLDDDDR